MRNNRSRCSGFNLKKKAFVGDIMTLIVFVFILAITIMVGYLILSNINNQWTAKDMGTVSKNIVNDQTNRYINLWDGLFGFLLVGLSLAAAISAYFIDTHPVLFPLLLIVLAAYIFVAASVSNAYWGIEGSTAFSSFAESFKLMHYVMNHLGYYAAIEGFIVFAALFAKTSQG